MTAEERQMQRADRYARAWLRWCAVETDASLERAEAFARSCAEWAMRGVPAAYAEQGGAIGLPLAPEPPEPRSGQGGPVPAQPVASREGARGSYARDSGDPGAAPAYRPEWAAPLAPGERRR